MAALIAKSTGVEPEVVEGARGEFSIRVGDAIVARKDSSGFPTDDEAVERVRKALGR